MYNYTQLYTILLEKNKGVVKMEFLGGLFIGALIGFFTAGLCAAGKDDR